MSEIFILYLFIRIVVLLCEYSINRFVLVGRVVYKLKKKQTKNIKKDLFSSSMHLIKMADIDTLGFF